MASACSVNERGPEANLAPLTQTPYFAVVTSDYASTAIALLNQDHQLITEAWIDSGTTSPSISATLSGDLVLPTVPLALNTLTLIDRLGVDVITRISVPDGTVLGQTLTQLPTQEGQIGYRSNPQDIVLLEGTQVLVSRHEPNLAKEIDALEKGNDLAVLDVHASALLARIDFSTLNVIAEGETFYARPARMVRIGDYILVGLARLSLDFAKAGPGALAILNSKTFALTEFSLEPLRNCGEVAPAPKSPQNAYILCSGPPRTSEAERRVYAGIARVAMAVDGTAVLDALWKAQDHPDAPSPSLGLVPWDDNHVLASAAGDLQSRINDRLLNIDLTTGSYRVIYTAGAAFVLGYGSYDALSGAALIPDATLGVHMFDPHTSQLLTTTETSPLRQLPAREVRPLR